MKFINKKGLSTMSIVIAIIIALLILAWNLGLFDKIIKSAQPVVKMVGQDALGDFDGDTIPNSFDDCPCGSPAGELNKMITYDRQPLCVSSYDPHFTEEDCIELSKQKGSVYEYVNIKGKVDVLVGDRLLGKQRSKLETLDGDYCLYSKPKNFACPKVTRKDNVDESSPTTKY